MHIPPYATTNIAAYSNTIVGIQGPPGSGKTTAALTFPNPLFALFDKPDFEGVLKDLPHLKDVKPTLMEFFDATFCHSKEKLGRPWAGEPSKPLHDPAGAFKWWLDNEGPKLTQEQTLVLDNWTRLQEHFDRVNWSAPLYPTYSKSGEVNEFAPWDRKIEYAEDVHNALLELKCNVVVLFHEVQEREQGTGRLLDKIQPLQQGKFVAKIKSYYPNFYRQHARLKKDQQGKPVEPREVEYLWQTRSSDSFDAKCSRPSLPALVPATYASLIKPSTITP